jgi:hypothetical protein
MNLGQLVSLVRKYTRDSGGSLFKEADVKEFINDGVDRIRHCTELKDMLPLEESVQVPILLPPEYHRLIALFATARCFSQDEQHYQATNFMNEFENKFSDMQDRIRRGEIIIKDALGNIVPISNTDIDYVRDEYFGISVSDTEIIEG